MSNFNTNYSVALGNRFSQPAAQIARSAQAVSNRFNRLSNSSMSSSRSFNRLGANMSATLRPSIALSGAVSSLTSSYNNMTRAQVRSNGAAVRLNSTNLSLPPNINRTTRSLNRNSQSLSRNNSQLTEQERRARAVARAQRDVSAATGTAKGAFIGAAPGAIFAAQAIKSAAAFERTEIAIKSMAGDEAIGKKLVGQILEFTSKSVLQEQKVLSVTKRLKAYGVANEEILPTVKMLGNFSAALDAPLDRLALVYGQVRAKGKLMAQEINQFGEAGVPLLETLSKGLGVSKKTILKLGEKGQISFELVKKALKSLVKEGKPFHNMLEKLAETTDGAFLIFQDNFEKTKRAFGELLIEAFSVKDVTNFLTNQMIKLKVAIKGFNKESPGVTKFVTRFAALALVIGPTVIAFGALIKVMSLIGTAVAASLGLTLGAFFGITIAVAAVVAALWWMYDNWDSVTGFIQSWRADSAVFDSIVTAATDAIEATVNLFEGKFDDEIGGTIEQIAINFQTTMDKIKTIVSGTLEQIGINWKENIKGMLEFEFIDSIKKKGMQAGKKIKSWFADDEETESPKVSSIKSLRGLNNEIVAVNRIESGMKQEGTITIDINDPNGAVAGVRTETIGPLSMSTGINAVT